MSPRCPRGCPLALLALLALCSGLSGLWGLPGGSGRCRVGPVTPGTPRQRCPEVAPSPPGDTELVTQSRVGFGLGDTERDPERGREWGPLWGSVVMEHPGELQFLMDAPLRVVAAGQELRDFGDIEEEPKVIGYFEGRDSESFQAFSAAARRFHPSLLFFVTFDPQAAQDLGLGLNQVHLYEPFLEQPRSFGGHPGDPPGIEAFLERHGRATLRKVKAQGVSEIWEDASDGIHIVAFAQGDDPDGFEFLETLREVAGDKRDDPNFSVLWIDPGDFPMLVPSWEDTFDIDLSRPQLGVLNGTDPASSVWLDMEDEEDLPGPEEVLEWLEEVLEGDTGDGDEDDDDNDDDDEDDDEDEDEDDDDDKVDDNDNDAD